MVAMETQAVFDPKVRMATPPKINLISGALGFGGVVLCLTFIGAVIGVPMIILSCMMMKPDKSGVLQGACPKCVKVVRVSKVAPAFDCPICKARVIVSGDKFQVFD